jgi:hypothetical protein
MDFTRTHSLPVVKTGIGRLGILSSHLPEEIFVDNRGIHPHAQFQKQDSSPLLAAYASSNF